MLGHPSNRGAKILLALAAMAWGALGVLQIGFAQGGS